MDKPTPVELPALSAAPTLPELRQLLAQAEIAYPDLRRSLHHVLVSVEQQLGIEQAPRPPRSRRYGRREE